MQWHTLCRQTLADASEDTPSHLFHVVTHATRSTQYIVKRASYPVSLLIILVGTCNVYVRTQLSQFSVYGPNMSYIIRKIPCHLATSLYTFGL